MSLMIEVLFQRFRTYTETGQSKMKHYFSIKGEY